MFYPLGSSYLVGKSVKYRCIEFFAYLLSVGDCGFPLVALDKIKRLNN